MLDTEIYYRLLAAVEKNAGLDRRLDGDAAAAFLGLDTDTLKRRLLAMARLDPRVPPLLGRIAFSAKNRED